jgi:hypothetical protein
LTRRQGGASLAIILVVLALVMVAFMATYALSRITVGSGDREVTQARLIRAAEALEHYAATSGRLPCPAIPTLDQAVETGEEVVAGNGCHIDVAEGVLPWKTIGLRRDDAYDAWGRRISYRVYTGAGGGNRGSLTQAGGASMVGCDTDAGEPAPEAADATTGLCLASRNTNETNFLAGKGLTLTDMNAAAHPDVAYVLVSHGATGMGGYPNSGVRLATPTSLAERNNMRQTGDFTIRAFSASNVMFNDNDHFDDLLVYRRLPELVRRTGLVARNWPEAGEVQFNPSSVLATAAAAGATTSGSNTGTPVIDFGNVLVVGIGGGDTANISADSDGSTGGIGVAVGANPMMTFYEEEALVAIFDDAGTRFGITLANFGTYDQAGTTMTEKVILAFFNGETFVHAVEKSACRPDGGYASLEVNVGAAYDGVLIVPTAATGTTAGGASVTGDTQVLVAEIRTCPATAASCPTSLSSLATRCP